MREPVTVADQPVLLEPDDVDELVDMLLDAAAVIGALAGYPAAEDARAGSGNGPQASCEELAVDLRLAAAGLDEASAPPGACPGNGAPGKPAHQTGLQDIRQRRRETPVTCRKERHAGSGP